MNSVFSTVFPRRATFLAVVHAFTLEQTAREASVALENGADGVFLIAGSLRWAALCQAHAQVRQEHPSAWIGANFLDLRANEAFEHAPPDLHGLWSDNAGILEGKTSHPLAEQTQSARELRRDVLYFGGVAFKYQTRIGDFEGVAQAAMPFVDVVTTTGEGTGEAPETAKIERMRAALGDFPLAIASGITPENVTPFLGVADCFLVATGVSRNVAEFDPQRVRALSEAVRAFS